ncbi:MAG TPA: AAA family ATPase [Pseudonocardiaceae bacterium]|nr:AAA family ATPase [Pseudonocardiaceae bacterium]
MAATWPLTGRAEELRLIGELLHSRDGPLGVVLAGAAGVGKTRLAREALAVAQQRSAARVPGGRRRPPQREHGR